MSVTLLFNYYGYKYMKEKILVLAASNNKKGNSYVAAHWFLEDINKDKYDVELVHLYDLDINYFTNENRKALPEIDPEDKDIRDLITKIEKAKHVVITTPIWNFGVPATLKNLIDRVMYSGRVWSEEKKKKVPGWTGKKFYLIFTCGGPCYSLAFNRYAIGQLYWILGYYGASRKIVKIIYNCGNGSKSVIDNRNSLKKVMRKKGRKLFR